MPTSNLLGNLPCRWIPVRTAQDSAFLLGFSYSVDESSCVFVATDLDQCVYYSQVSQSVLLTQVFPCPKGEDASARVAGRICEALDAYHQLVTGVKFDERAGGTAGRTLAVSDTRVLADPFSWWFELRVPSPALQAAVMNDMAVKLWATIGFSQYCLHSVQSELHEKDRLIAELKLQVKHLTPPEAGSVRDSTPASSRGFDPYDEHPWNKRMRKEYEQQVANHTVWHLTQNQPSPFSCASEASVWAFTRNGLGNSKPLGKTNPRRRSEQRGDEGQIPSPFKRIKLSAVEEPVAASPPTMEGLDRDSKVSTNTAVKRRMTHSALPIKAPRFE